MRYLIISDIHSNLESLSKIEDNFLSHLIIDSIICLGDIVGYNADPGPCLSYIFHTLKATTIRGNHDRAVAFNDFTQFSDKAMQAGKWSREHISPEQIVELTNLTKGPKIINGQFGISHGSPINEDKYILSRYDSIPEFLWLQRTGINILFFGHTHVAETYICNKYADMNNPWDIKISTKRFINIRENNYYCINPGSLGQPRDNNPLASCVIFDTQKMTVEFIRFPYAIEETQKKIINRRVPYGSFSASRLLKGE